MGCRRRDSGRSSVVVHCRELFTHLRRGSKVGADVSSNLWRERDVGADKKCGLFYTATQYVVRKPGNIVV
ncbi:hypothetical protein KC344_g103 [Hortaea werneckii]|nr:hypothetical protein KC344_g103 [Hortaea werneckii]